MNEGNTRLIGSLLYPFAPQAPPNGVRRSRSPGGARSEGGSDEGAPRDERRSRPAATSEGRTK